MSMMLNVIHIFDGGIFIPSFLLLLIIFSKFHFPTGYSPVAQCRVAMSITTGFDSVDDRLATGADS
jgi:hypothetical protein